MFRLTFIMSREVAAVYETYPPKIRRSLFVLRELIFATAASIEGVGDLEETLKWGEPAYITSKSKSGSMIRLAWKKSHPLRYGAYFHCQTNLVETFRTLFPDDFEFEGNRGLIFQEGDAVPLDALAYCFAAALTYHRRK